MENKKNKTKKPSCCQESSARESKGFFQGILYGLLPHTGCIAFVVFTVVGVTAAASIFRLLLLNANFFYALIMLSFILATVSAVIYLKKNKMLSFEGIKRKKSYLTIMYGTTILMNLLFFFVIFPWAANINNNALTGSVVYSGQNSQNELKIQVAIPCPGHALLITNELKTIEGVTNVKFDFPNLFYVKYDPTKTNEQQILSLNIFKEYAAKVISTSKSTSLAPQTAQTQTSGGCCGSGSCGSGSGGSCGSCGGIGSCSNRNY